MKAFVFAATFAIGAGALFAPAQAQTAQRFGDPEAGAEVFARDCARCHQVGEEAQNRTGPQLNRIFGREAGHLEGFRYSRGLRRRGIDGLVWDYETLDAYIANPRALVTGTNMAYRGLRDADERHNLIAYLRAFSDRPQDIPESAPTAIRTVPELTPEVLAMRGDPAYGEYLSGECATCHQVDGDYDGIPPITGWNEEDFVLALHSYRQGLRPHPVMEMIAARLDDEQIAALAAYFGGLEAQ